MIFSDSNLRQILIIIIERFLKKIDELFIKFKIRTSRFQFLIGPVLKFRSRTSSKSIGITNEKESYNFITAR